MGLKEELKLIISGDASGALKAFKSVGVSAQDMGAALAKFGKMAAVAAGAAAVAGIAAVAAVVKKSISNFIDNELIQTKLANTIKNTGKETGVTVQQINKLAAEMQRLTRFEDDNVSAAGEILARYRTIGSETFPQVLALSADLAESLGVDITQAAEMMGKALVAPGEGMRVLKQAGVALTDEQQKLIDKLMAGGKVAEAQKLILDLLSESIGGVAVAAGKTSSGQLDILKNQIDGLFDRIGEALGPGFESALSFFSTTLSLMLSDPAVIMGIQNIGREFSNMAASLPQTARSLREIYGFLSMPPSAGPGAVFAEIGKASEAWVNSGLVTQMISDITNCVNAVIHLNTVLKNMGQILTFEIIKAFQTFMKSPFVTSTRAAFAGIASAIDGISRAIQNVISWFAKLPSNIPSWLIPGSPTPFEMGLRGISSELDNISKKTLPSLTNGVSFSTGGANNQTSEMTGIRDEIRFLVRTLPRAIANANA